MTDNKRSVYRQTGLNKMAEGIAMHRLAESSLPEDERLFSDPYAACFIDPGMLDWIASHETEVRAIADEFEKNMPGWSNSIRTRVRLFDDLAREEVQRGIEQVVILGAGYDTRAYRISDLKKVRIFEVDRKDTVVFKTGKISEILGSMPGNVSYIPADLEIANLAVCLESSGYSREKKTLFILEGLVMYMSREAVEKLLSGIRIFSAPDSAIIFDFIPASMADGSSDRSDARYIRDYTVTVGEPLRSGFKEGEIIPNLEDLGYRRVRIITVDEFRRRYYQGKNANRQASDLMSVAYARVS